MKKRAEEALNQETLAPGEPAGRLAPDELQISQDLKLEESTKQEPD